MSNDPGFELFAFNIQQDVIASSRDNSSEAFAEDQFSELVLEYLADAGEIDDLQLCSHQARGIKVNGYDFYNDNQYLDLFVTLFTGDCPPIRVLKTEILTNFKRLRTFFDRAVKQKYKNLEESSPAFDLADEIYRLQSNITNIRLFVLTDGIANVDAIEDEIHGQYKISHHVWDMERLYRLWSSGNRPEPIEIDFNNDFGQTITCLPMPEENSKYTTYMAIISGETLANLYEKYGPRLLERNVRAFLQMRGNVNKGIRDTIRNEPEMFLAYNNGISATADWIDIGESPNRMPVIKRIRDFQIVNGAQTTASIYHTHTKDKQDVSRVYVQLKLTVLKNAGDTDRIVPKISQCANSQNKINAADFTSNDPFHIQIQKLSRSIWAPANKGSQQETHWYYERARGQYQDDKGREKTPKLRRLFGEQNPTSQRFSKTDLAKFENSWNQLPHVVSLGAEKNYRDFILRYREKGEFEPNTDYFQLLVSKTILFKRTDKIVKRMEFGGYKANIVTYTIAILSILTEKRINLEKVWKNQDISATLEETIKSISQIVHKHITNPPGGKNITEWCKKEECWNSLLKLKIDIPPSLEKELVSKQVVDQREIKVQNLENILEKSNEELLSNHKKETEAFTEEKSHKYDTLINDLTPHDWIKIINDAENSLVFSNEQINLLKKCQKMAFRKICPQKNHVESIKEILQVIDERVSPIKVKK